MTTKLLSIEDGDLESSIAGSRSVPYSDLDLAFQAKPSGDIYKKIDAAAVKQAVRNLLTTNRFDKPFRPNFGADLQALLFDLADPLIEQDIEQKIISSITAYEPRAQVRRVVARAKPDNNEVSVSITFVVVNTNEEITLSTSVSRLR